MLGLIIKLLIGLVGLDSGVCKFEDKIFFIGMFYLFGILCGWGDVNCGGYGWIDLCKLII